MTEQSFKKPLVFADTKEQSKGMKQRLNCRIRLGQKKKKKKTCYEYWLLQMSTLPPELQRLNVLYETASFWKEDLKSVLWKENLSHGQLSIPCSFRWYRIGNLLLILKTSFPWSAMQMLRKPQVKKIIGSHYRITEVDPCGSDVPNQNAKQPSFFWLFLNKAAVLQLWQIFSWVITASEAIMKKVCHIRPLLELLFTSLRLCLCS